MESRAQSANYTETGSWNGHKFIVSPRLIRGFTGLSIKGASETDVKTASSQQYIKRKAGKPMEVTLTVGLNAALGCNVRVEALKFITDARSGASNYLYIGNKKLVTCQLMLTAASVDEVEIAPNNKWHSAKVNLTMTQASKNDGSTGGGTGSSSGGSSSSGGVSSSGGGGTGGSNKISVNTQAAANKKDEDKKKTEKTPAQRAQAAIDKIKSDIKTAKIQTQAQKPGTAGGNTKYNMTK